MDKKLNKIHKNLINTKLTTLHHIINWPEILATSCLNSVNGERFAGLNFRIFCGFQEHRESFPVNIIQALYNGIVFKCCKRKAPQKFSREKLRWVESVKV